MVFITVAAVKLFLQLSSVWSGWYALHFKHTGFLEQTFFKCPYFWPRWHLLRFGIYFSTFADIYPIFNSDGSFGLLNVNISVGCLIYFSDGYSFDISYI